MDFRDTNPWTFNGLKEGTLQKAECKTNYYGQIIAWVHKGKIRKAKAQNERPSSKEQILKRKIFIQFQIISIRKGAGILLREEVKLMTEEDTRKS